MHTGEKPFSCKFCPRDFIQKANFLSHEKSCTRYNEIKSFFEETEKSQEFEESKPLKKENISLIEEGFSMVEKNKSKLNKDKETEKNRMNQESNFQKQYSCTGQVFSNSD